MELNTVNQIRDLRDRIREQIKNIDKANYTSTTYGGENEYTFKGVVGGIECLLTDISTLTRAPKKFVKISTHSERNSIAQYLTRIDMYFDNPAHYISQFEELKVLLRNYNVRNFSERQLEFEEEIEAIVKLKLQVQEELKEITNLKEEISSNNESIEEKFKQSTDNLEKIEVELTQIIERKTELTTESDVLEEANKEVIRLKEEAAENLDDIKDSASECKSNEKLISSFAAKVQEREKKVEELEQRTNENTKKLQEYETERQEILAGAKNLIDSAKKALNYKTAEGISASFQEHYKLSNNKWIIAGWIIGATVCLIGTIVLGVWILENTTTSIGIVLGRVSMLPLPIIGAIFCANQYTKQKNIIEDYAYKMVLSKAIVGFSEQLKKNSTGDNEEYVHYIKTALEEIHKDPLRKREKTKDEKTDIPKLSSLVEFAEKIIKFSKIEK